MQGWIGVDLDGTLARYAPGDYDPLVVGEPIPLMVERVKKLLARGQRVKIFTARVDGGSTALAMGNAAGVLYRDVERIRKVIQDWCEEHLGVRLEVTNQKDYGMIELWDDRARRVELNTGRFIL